MKRVFIYTVLIASSLFGLSSCEDMLKVTPKQSIDAKEAFTSFDDVKAGLYGTYDQLKSSGYYGRDFVIISELLGDNMKIHSKNSNRFTNEQNNVVGNHVAIWSYDYRIINRVNNILQNIDRFSDANDSNFENKKSEVKAEALFLRAFAYFDLARSYSREPQYNVNADLGVPIIEKVATQISEIEYPSRSTTAQVWAYIEQNLADAKVAMTSANRTVASNGPAQVSLAAIVALQSRVYLYQNKWQLAADAATEAMTLSGLGLANGGNEYYKIFAEGKETIWSLHLSVESESLGFDCLASIQNKLSGNGYGDAILRNDMVNQYAPLTKPSATDKTTWTSPDARYSVVKWGNRTATDVQIPWNIKFNSWKGSFGMDDVPLIRFSELVLNRAEALSELNNDAEALVEVNKIRVRAGLTPLAATVIGQALKDAIAKERRIEFAFEGHRYWDLKRKQKNITKGIASDYSATNEAFVPWTDYRVVARIPIGEVDMNKNLKQNPGY